ncbi:uncharacterized protein LOC134064416 [Sardina pilchardus]|uniref:uncharacterized protein LOC134064416 n=1 Tax=Sardina pilchardus TaxID=27697 RepID=UPI002E0EE0BC
MKTCGALLVLLCCLADAQLRGDTISDNDITHQGHYGEAETREDEGDRTETAATVCNQQTCQPDIHTLLREMSALVAEQRVELRYTKTQMDAIEARLRASENKAETMENRLRANQAVNLNLTGSQVEKLWRDREERKVSFSTSVQSSGGGHNGPFSAKTTVIFRHVFTNIGNGYNASTGVFTAPVRGVYHFVLFLHGYGHQSGPVAASLRKNGEKVVSPYSWQTSGNMTPSNGASLLLEVGDVVYVQLWANAWFFDNINHHTTFSGHLLFPM